MKIRPYTPDDLGQVVEMAKKYKHPLDLRHQISSGVVENNGKIVGYGWIEPIIVAEMFLDGKKSERVQALDLLHRQALIQTALARFDQLYAFCKDSDFADVMKKHYSYQTCDRILVREV